MKVSRSFTKTLLPLIFIIAVFSSCSDKTKPESPDQIVPEEVKADTQQSVYAKADQSSFKILSVDSNSGYTFSTVEVNYKSIYISLAESGSPDHYIAKITASTKTCTGCESQDRNIKVEISPFSNPKKKLLTIERKCDDVTFDVRTYKTVVFGCCGAPDKFAIYDYHNKLIIASDDKVIYAEMPNSKISIYVGFQQELTDSTILGTLYYAYDSSDRYAIKIKSTPLPSEDCSPYAPELSIHSSKSKDKFDKENNTYTLWSLDGVDDKSQINDLSLIVAFDCAKHLHLPKINIPIIHGKPFGKEEKNQEIIFNHK